MWPSKYASVLIVGAGPVGLTLAMDLAWRARERQPNQSNFGNGCVAINLRAVRFSHANSA